MDSFFEEIKKKHLLSFSFVFRGTNVHPIPWILGMLISLSNWEIIDNFDQ